jgi:hypothetical protein
MKIRALLTGFVTLACISSVASAQDQPAANLTKLVIPTADTAGILAPVSVPESPIDP